MTVETVTPLELPCNAPRKVATFYVGLGFQIAFASSERVVARGFGVEFVFTKTDTDPAPRESIDIAVELHALDDIWARMRKRNPAQDGPTFGDDGQYRYCVNDPEGYQLSFVASVSESYLPPDHITRRTKPVPE